MNKENIKSIISVIILIIIDQIIKFFIAKYYINDIIIINNFLKLTYLTNTGAALGILSNNMIFLIIISILLIWYVLKEIIKSSNKLNKVSLLLILSGALGNLIDRIFRGYVIDYISFTLLNREMPIFNN